MPALTRDEIADILARAYDGKPLADLRDEHAAHHREAADTLSARIDALVAEVESATVEDVLWRVEQAAGDMAAQQVRDQYPELGA